MAVKFQGCGLDMASAHGIVENHGGWIEVESQPEKGTLVKIYLPTAENRKLGGRSQDQQDVRQTILEKI